jgi:hypothetical protein
MKSLLKKLFGKKPKLKPLSMPESATPLHTEREVARERLRALGYSHEFLHKSPNFTSNIAE